MPIEYEIRIEPEEMDYHGNCSAIDPDTDRENEQWITDQLSSGNGLAWCWVEIKATFEGYEGSDSLGGCSYKSRADLEEGLIPEMKENALANLRAKLKRIQVEGPKDARKAARVAKVTLAKLDKEGR